MSPRLQLRLDATRELSPSVRHLLFSVEGAPTQYRAGQSVDLHVPASGELHRRAYSIACAQRMHDGQRLELAVTRVPDGPASNALHQLTPGTRLKAEPPTGYLIRREPQEPTLFIATGTGLSPFRAMLQDELAREDGANVALLFGCRTRKDILWADELYGWSARHPRFQLFVTLSRPEPEWQGRTGYVQRHLEDVLAQVKPTRVFICGLSFMTHAVERLLLAAGFPEAGILLEEYDS